jgi:hypothetical protein
LPGGKEGSFSPDRELLNATGPQGPLIVPTAWEQLAEVIRSSVSGSYRPVLPLQVQRPLVNIDKGTFSITGTLTRMMYDASPAALAAGRLLVRFTPLAHSRKIAAALDDLQ